MLSGDIAEIGTYWDQEPIVCLNRGVRNLYMHKRVELCENALVRYYKYYKRSLLK